MRHAYDPVVVGMCLLTLFFSLRGRQGPQPELGLPTTAFPTRCPEDRPLGDGSWYQNH